MKHLLLLFGGLAIICVAGRAGTIVVTSTADDGPGSLRSAIAQANATPGRDEIQFALPGASVQTIQPLTPLPAIVDAVTLDGYSQPGSRTNSLGEGWDGVLLVRLDGIRMTNGIGAGLTLRGGAHTVRGLVIVNFYDGILLDSCAVSVVAGNFIGLDTDGLVSGNRGDGVNLQSLSGGDSSNNTIGGTAPSDRNIISGNSRGVFMFPTGSRANRVLGNYIGTDASGTLPRGNAFDGIFIQAAPDNVIGGREAGARNVISANGPTGSGVVALGASRAVVQGNYIGTDVTGRYSLGNGSEGIRLQGADHCLVGGVQPGAGNLIANNAADGVNVAGGTANVIQGNLIGTAPTRTRPLGNKRAGILVSANGGHLVGGTGPGEANEICYSGASGVVVTTSFSDLNGIVIRGNSLHDNRGQGIDLWDALGRPGPDANDPGDADFGGNGGQNWPELRVTGTTAGSVQVQGTLMGTPSVTYLVDFYCSPEPKLPGHVEGQAWAGAISVATSADGVAAFETEVPVVLGGARYLTATATDSKGNTSEFSSPVVFSAPVRRPNLEVAHGGGAETLLRWPAAGPGFILESSPVLSEAAPWNGVDLPANIIDNMLTVRIPHEGGEPSRFFRLRAE